MKRTVTIHTSDRGPVTIPEPTWCLGEHVADGCWIDITHSGPEETLEFRDEPLWTLELITDPTVPDPARRLPRLYVEQTGFARTLDPAGLDALADALVEHAAGLRARAQELAMLVAKEPE
ncbi:DUF6907 domain-containing protein [Streptomyces sp. NPDC101455]|uniref:DUF6907 domain-containing protein n=1 Tax=Streptomyces sp. NPDC101455 TaxID=3366142 RepID=UPI00381C50F6